MSPLDLIISVALVTASGPLRQGPLSSLLSWRGRRLIGSKGYRAFLAIFGIALMLSA